MQITADDIALAVKDLAPMPEICTRLLEKVNDEASSLEDIADLIASDPALTAQVLRLANSPFYGQTRQVDSLPKAMMVTGMQAVVALVLASCSVQTLSRLKGEGMDMYRFWEHSVYVSAVARELAQQHHRCIPDQAFLAGLLHDVGLLALAAAYPEVARILEVKRRSWHGPTYQVEEAWMGFHHGHVAAALLRQWNFPEALVVAIEHHHCFQPEQGHGALQATLIVADTLAHQAALGRGREREPIDWPAEVLDYLELSETQTEAAAEAARGHLDRLMKLILPPAKAA